ncbi:MAG: hypothetical protein AAGD34_01665 [Pseudomonadota bacterium]
MSGTRRHRLARLARAQRAAARRAEVEAVASRTAHTESVQEGDGLVQALNSDSPWHGLFLDAMAEALLRNGRRTETLRRASEAADAVLRRDSTRADRLDELLAKALRREAAAEERRRLEALALRPADRDGRMANPPTACPRKPLPSNAP